MIVAELMALRAMVAALARETLLRHGSDAFVHAEAQALKFGETQLKAVKSPAEFEERVKGIIRDTFAMADGVA